MMLSDHTGAALGLTVYIYYIVRFRRADTMVPTSQFLNQFGIFLKTVSSDGETLDFPWIKTHPIMM